MAFLRFKYDILIGNRRPGDHVYWQSDGEKIPSIVQSVNAQERTAMIGLPSTGQTELASLLELDPHGTSDLSGVQPISIGETLGVNRGDFAFVHGRGTTNGLLAPRVPFIGELEGWVRETGVTQEGKLCGWRAEMADLGTKIASQRGPATPHTEGLVRRLERGDTSLSWFGEVVQVGVKHCYSYTFTNRLSLDSYDLMAR